MEIAEVTSYTQSGSGVAWSSLNNLGVKDSRYAYSTLNGSAKGTAKPKNMILTDVMFNIASFNPLKQEFFIEYKMYLDEPLVPDNSSSLKRPNILITFYDGTTHLIENDDYLSDDFHELFLTRNEKVNANITLNHLVNPFTIEFIFEEYRSARNTDVTVMIDYVTVKIVEWEEELEWVLGDNEIMFIPIFNNGGLTIVAGEGDATGNAYIDEENKIGIAVFNKREDEVFYIMFPNDIVRANNSYYTEGNGYFGDYDELNNCAVFHANVTDPVALGQVYVDFKRAGVTDIYLCSNYGDDCTLTMTVTPQDYVSLDGSGMLQKTLVDNGRIYYDANISFELLGEAPSHYYGYLSYIIEVDNATIVDDSNVRVIGDDGTVILNGDDENYQTGNPYWEVFDNALRVFVPVGYPNAPDSINVSFMAYSDTELPSYVDVTYTYPMNNSIVLPTFVNNVLNDSFTRVNPVSETLYQRIGMDNVVWVGGDEYSEFTFSAHHGNYFQFLKPKQQISVGYPVAYIGAVQLSRGHKADVTASTTNSSSKEVYQNRAYLGKKGDWNEKISMTLRIPWQDVVTLQNHVKHDSPIAIDTCPDLPDGDPLNHRGWAEIYGVNNIKKINEFLYQCEPDVEYLTHEIMGKFTIQQLNRICNKEIDYSISNTHEYYEDIRDVLGLSSYQDFMNLTIDTDSYKGVYEVPSDTTYTFKTLNSVSTISEWSFRWRNILPTIDSNAYDGDNWNMAFRVVDRDTRKIYCEYMYTNFRHITDNDELLNECDVKITRLAEDGEYDITNYAHMNLDFDEASATAYQERANTSIEVQEYIETFERGHNVQFRLIDWNGDPLYDKFVDVNVFNDRGETVYTYDDEVQSFTTITNSNGVGEFEFNQNRGVYRIQFKFMGDDGYNECYAESKLYMNIENNTYTYFDIPENQVFTTSGKYFTGRLMTGANAPLLNRKVKIYVKRTTSKKWWTPYVKTTNANGEFKLQINLSDGLYNVKCEFPYADNYNSCSETVKIKVKHGSGTATKLVTSDLVVPATDVKNKSYSFDAILQTSGGKAIKGQNITFTFYSEAWDTVTTYTKTTNSKGVASKKIELNSGIYYVDVSYDGVANKYKPCNASNTVHVKASELILTEVSMYDLVINDCLHHELGATLEDEYGNKLINYPIRFELINKSTKKKYTYTHYTNYEGMAELNINYDTGNWTTQAFFDGADRYRKSKSAVRSMKIKRPAKQQVYHSIQDKYTYGQNEQVDFTVKNGNNEGVAGVPVSIYIYDNNTKTKVNYHIQIVNSHARTNDVAEHETDSNGLLSFIPQLKAGTYTMEIHSYCSGNYLAKVSQYLINIQENQKMSTSLTPLWTSSNPFTLNTPPHSQDRAEVLLTDANGDALANKTIVFNVFSKKYYKTTDARGIAYLTINASATSGRPMQISFDGDEGYGTCSINGTLNVNSSYPSISNNVPVAYTGEATLTLLNYAIDTNTNTYVQNVTQFPWYTQVHLVNNANNVNMVNRTVSFTVYGENKEANTYYRTTDDYGIATFEFLKHDNNNYPVTVRLEDDSFYAPEVTFNYIVDIDYNESDMSSATTIDRSDIAEGLNILETPDPNDYDGSIVGSTLNMFFNNNTLEIHDYGLCQDIALHSGKINVDNIILPDGDYDIEINVSYNNEDNFVEELIGTMQVQVNEVTNIAEYKTMYTNLICSPAVIPEYECIFTREAEDGRIYYYDTSTKEATKKYRLSPFLQYKNGVNLETENGVSLFNLNTSISPIIVNNGLVKIAFHKNSGYVYIYRYKSDNDSWVMVRILKIKNYDYINLDEYSLDKISVTFGKSKFTIYRGRPFIEVKHEKEDIYFTKQVGRVWCETEKNGFVFTPTDANQVNVAETEFLTNNAVNLLPYDLYISENIRTTNFVVSNMKKEAVYELDNRKALKVTYNAVADGSKFLTFPKKRMELPSKTVTVLFNRFKTNTGDVQVQLYGYDSENASTGTPIITEDITADILHNGELNQVRVTFEMTDAQYEEYSHFAIAVRMVEPSLNDWILLNQIMLYDGSDEIPYEADNTDDRLENTEIYFENNYYVKLYNKAESYGLAIVRPYMDSLKLGYIPKSKVTVLIPYLKHSNFYDTPEMVSIEYLYSKDEVTKIQGENYGI